jgi:phage anti-repressor protein/predicted GIY-YIG superfamily endonuclease
MIEFLKKYSAVDNAFIDDFFSHVDPSSADDMHTVNLELAAKWLKVLKGNLMQTLRSAYVEGQDYVVTKPAVRVPGRGRNNRRDVMLTTDAFKTLCMQSRSQQADRVRAYFIAVEKTLFRYRAEIMAAMQARIGRLESNQRPLAASVKRAGVIYVIRASEGTSLYKLGRTTDLAARLRSHSSARADALEVMFVYKTDDVEAVEACAKGVLKGTQYRKYKEVYESDVDTIKKVIEGCGAMVTKVQARHRKASQTGGAADTQARTFMVFSHGT